MPPLDIIQYSMSLTGYLGFRLVRVRVRVCGTANSHPVWVGVIILLVRVRVCGTSTANSHPVWVGVIIGISERDRCRLLLKRVIIRIRYEHGA